MLMQNKFNENLPGVCEVLKEKFVGKNLRSFECYR